MKEVYYSDNEFPPLAGAVDHLLTKILWGTTYNPATTEATATGFATGVLKALGTYTGSTRMVPSTPFMATVTAATTVYCTAVKYMKQVNGEVYPVFGWKANASFGVDKGDGGTGAANAFVSQRYKIGRPFTVRAIYFNTSGSDSGGITPTVYTDYQANNVAGAVFNSTNYSGQKSYYYDNLNLKGMNDLQLKIQWAATSSTVVYLPITILIDVEGYETK